MYSVNTGDRLLFKKIASACSLSLSIFPAILWRRCCQRFGYSPYSSHHLDFLRPFSRFLSVALLSLSLVLVSFSVSAQKPEEEKPAESKNADWAISVEKPSIDFAPKEIKEIEARALNEVRKISSDIQQLKGEVIELNKDLRLMEEKLLFPSSTKYSVFVSLSSGQFFDLESIKLKVDGRFVATHVYSEKQRNAMLRGGVHRLYITNLSEGKHQIIAFMTGIGPGERSYKRAAELEIKKGPGSQYLEIAVSDDSKAQEPVLMMKEW